MPHFVVSCLDKPDSLELRLANRADHLAYVAERRGFIPLAGPLLDAGEQMIGSLLVLDVEDEAAARAFVDGDPYQRAGLFADVRVQRWKVTVGALG